MTKLTDGERLVALETKMDTVLDNQKTQTQEFKDLNEKLGKLLPTFVTQADLKDLKRKSSIQVAVVGLITAVLSSIITFLVVFFLNNIGGK